MGWRKEKGRQSVLEAEALELELPHYFILHGFLESIGRASNLDTNYVFLTLGLSFGVCSECVFFLIHLYKSVICNFIYIYTSISFEAKISLWESLQLHKKKSRKNKSSSLKVKNFPFWCNFVRIASFLNIDGLLAF